MFSVHFLFGLLINFLDFVFNLAIVVVWLLWILVVLILHVVIIFLEFIGDDLAEQRAVVNSFHDFGHFILPLLLYDFALLLVSVEHFGFIKLLLIN